VLSSRFK